MKTTILILSLLIMTSCATKIFSRADSEFEQGLALFNRGRHEQAIPHFERAIELDPDFARAYLYLGRSYLSLKRWRQALPPLRTAYRLAPEPTKREALDFLIDALFGVALSDTREGDFSSSISHFKEVMELDPESSRAREAQSLARDLQPR